MKNYGFKNVNDEDTARWYRFGGQVAKLTESQVEKFEFFLYNLYGEHIELKKDEQLNQQEVIDEFNTIGREAFMNKYMNRGK